MGTFHEIEKTYATITNLLNLKIENKIADLQIQWQGLRDRPMQSKIKDTILIVEDDTWQINFFMGALKNMTKFFNIDTPFISYTQSGKIAVANIKILSETGSLKFVLLDLHLPDMDGFEVIKQVPKETNIVVMSADPTLRDKALSYKNVIRFIEKGAKVSRREIIKIRDLYLECTLGAINAKI